MKVRIPMDVKQQVLERDKACAYCGRPVAIVVGEDAPFSQRWRALDKRGFTFHFDHKVPLSVGGENTADNICLACPECHFEKTRTLGKKMVRAGRPAMPRAIKLSQDVYDRLTSLKAGGETFDLLISELLALREKLQGILPK